jgi:hypothetical protein
MLPQITLQENSLYKTFDEAFQAKGCKGYFLNPTDLIRYYVYRQDQGREADDAYEHDFGKRPDSLVFVAL